MTEQRFISHSSPPSAAILWGLISLISLTIWLTTSTIEWLLVAMLPMTCALFTWRSQHQYELVLNESGLEISDPPRVIPWEEVGRIQIRRAAIPVGAPVPRQGLAIETPTAWVDLPGVFTPGLGELYASMLRLIPLGSSRPLPEKLRDFQEEQLQLFGPDRVWSFAGARNKLFRKPGRLSFLGVSFLVIGLVWIIHQAHHHRDPTFLLGLGVLLLLAGLILLLVSAVDFDSRTKIKNLDEIGLVISPKGLGMVQGKLSGILRWEEIHDISFNSHRRTQPVRGILLKLDGVDVIVHDIYDRPLAQIHELLQRYWGVDE